MKPLILTGILALATGLSSLMAQPQAGQQTKAPPAQPQQAQPQPAAPGQPKVPSPKSPAEGAAVMALQTTAQSAQSDPDAAIKAAEELVTKFADTDYKEFALSVEAQAYKIKGDVANAQVFAERALEVNPKSFQMMLLLGEVIDSKIGDFDLDREVRLAKAEKCFNDTIDVLKTVPKPNAQLPDDQWAQYKVYLAAEAHNGLGTLGLLRKKYDVAVTEFKAALDGDPEQDAYATRLASAYQMSGKNDEAIALCDKLLAKPQLHPQIKAAVNNIKTVATAAKNKK